MNKKRFIKGYHTIRDIKENNTYDFQVNIICDLLNELDEKYVDEFSLRETLQQELQRVEEENEELKSELENCRECLKLNRESCARHMKENEQLKSKNLILKGKLHQLRLKCGKQEEEIECLSEETIEKFKQDLQEGNFIEFTAR